MKKIRDALWYIAGVDSELMRESVGSDRIYATQLGLMLILAFIVVFAGVLHAMLFIGQDSFSWLHALLSVAVAFVVALTVVMIDRAVYQSDWFAMSDRTSSKWKRVSIRFGLSTVFSVIISLILLLSIFDATLKDRLHRWHREINAPLYQKLEDVLREYRSTHIDPLRADIKRIVTEKQKLRSKLSKYVDVDTTEKIRNLQNALEEKRGQRESLQQSIDDLQRSADQIQENIARINKLLQCEINGWGQVAYRDEILRCSRIPGANGPRAKAYRDELDIYRQTLVSNRNRLSSMETQFTTLESDIKKLENRLLQIPDTDRLRTEIDRLDQKYHEMTKQLQAEEEKLQTKKEEELKRVVHSVDYVPYKDDVFQRMSALLELLNDPKEGNTMLLSAAMIVVLVMFLELAPFIAKLFFSPPSVYAEYLATMTAQHHKAAQILRRRW